MTKFTFLERERVQCGDTRITVSDGGIALGSIYRSNGYSQQFRVVYGDARGWRKAKFFDTANAAARFLAKCRMAAAARNVKRIAEFRANA